MPYKDPVKRKEYQEKYRAENKEQNKDYQEKYRVFIRQHAIDSIKNGEIIDRHTWDLWCDTLKRGAKQNKTPYSEEFANDIMFDMMVRGCFYCGDIATTIDRIDSKLIHTPENCVGSCKGCNISKGAADPATFIRKAYYRIREIYIDDNTDIWFYHKTKPSMWHYERAARKKGVPFNLTREDFDALIRGVCEYCNRTPTTWFGIDRIIPLSGYVIGNSVPCCFDCNVDKYEDDVETMTKRNVRIANRVDMGELVIDDGIKAMLHQGVQKSAKKVCAYGKVYTSQNEASRALGKGATYVGNCIRNGWHSNDIFEISDD